MNKKIFFLFFLGITFCTLHAQESSDFTLLKKANEASYFYEDPYHRVDRKQKVNKGFSCGILILNIYKTMIADQLATDCIYRTTCSDFMRLSIYRFGFIKGVAIGLDRLGRCNDRGMKDAPSYKHDSDTGLIIDQPEEYEF